MARAMTIGPLCAAGMAMVACGESRGDLREWRASDHQPPPAVAPEGQGAAAEGAAPEQRAVVALWGMRCASCHGAEGRGDGAARPPGATLPDMTAEAFHAARDDARLVAAISEGAGLMPAFRSELSDAGVAALVAHIRTMRRGATP